MHDLAPTKLVGEVEKKPDEKISVFIPWARYLRNYWREAHSYSTGQHIFPSRSNGSEYECTTAGVSGSREPVWGSDATVTDGTVTWTKRAPDNSSLDPISASTWSGGGLTVSNTSVDADSQDAIARIEGGDAGEDYTVVNEITTTSGDEYHFELTVKVRSNVTS